MTAAVHEIPLAALFPTEAYNRPLLGKRVRHRHLQVMGRLTGWVREDRDVLWLQVDTQELGTVWWVSRSVVELGPIPLPRNTGGAA